MKPVIQTQPTSNSAVASRVRRVLDGEGISDSELSQMLARSAITRLRGFNRRFHDWLFKVEGGNVHAMVYADVTEVGQGKEKMTEDCESCFGSGCAKCGWHGTVIRRIE